MKFTSRNGKRVVELESRDHKVLSEAKAILSDVALVSEPELAEDAINSAAGIAAVIEAYPAKAKAEAATK